MPTTYINCNLNGFTTIAERHLEYSKHLVQCNYPDNSCYVWGVDREPLKDVLRSLSFAAVAVWHIKPKNNP